MVEWFANNLWAMWLAVAIALCIIEILMLDFIFLMLAVAALLTAGSALLIDSVVPQVLIFAGISIALLLGLRPPLIRKFHRGSPNIRMNSDGLIGQPARITQTVTSTTGLALIAGDIWTARPENEQSVIPEGSEALVSSIRGATAYLTTPPSYN